MSNPQRKPSSGNTRLSATALSSVGAERDSGLRLKGMRSVRWLSLRRSTASPFVALAKVRSTDAAD